MVIKAFVTAFLLVVSIVVICEVEPQYLLAVVVGSTLYVGLRWFLGWLDSRRWK